MTAMDAWMFICMLFVAMAKFEYAIQLKIRFGTLNKIGNKDEKDCNTKTEERCRKIDKFALRLFIAMYILTLGVYFYNLSSKA